MGRPAHIERPRSQTGRPPSNVSEGHRSTTSIASRHKRLHSLTDRSSEPIAGWEAADFETRRQLVSSTLVRIVVHEDGSADWHFHRGLEVEPISLPPLISTLTSSKLAKAARDYAKNGYSQKEADDLAAAEHRHYGRCRRRHQPPRFCLYRFKPGTERVTNQQQTVHSSTWFRP